MAYKTPSTKEFGKDFIKIKEKNAKQAIINRVVGGGLDLGEKPFPDRFDQIFKELTTEVLA